MIRFIVVMVPADVRVLFAKDLSHRPDFSLPVISSCSELPIFKKRLVTLSEFTLSPTKGRVSFPIGMPCFDPATPERFAAASRLSMTQLPAVFSQFRTDTNYEPITISTKCSC
jgi:hypothetical protein